MDGRRCNARTKTLRRSDRREKTMKLSIRITTIAFAALVAAPGWTAQDSGYDFGSAAAYWKRGAEGVKMAYHKAVTILRSGRKQWWVVKYGDGFCIYNHFKRVRTIDDVFDHTRGRGDCDWWPWPEG